MTFQPSWYTTTLEKLVQTMQHLVARITLIFAHCIALDFSCHAFPLQPRIPENCTSKLMNWLNLSESTKYNNHTLVARQPEPEAPFGTRLMQSHSHGEAWIPGIDLWNDDYTYHLVHRFTSQGHWQALTANFTDVFGPYPLANEKYIWYLTQLEIGVSLEDYVSAIDWGIVSCTKCFRSNL